MASIICVGRWDECECASAPAPSTACARSGLQVRGGSPARHEMGRLYAIERRARDVLCRIGCRDSAGCHSAPACSGETLSHLSFCAAVAGHPSWCTLLQSTAARRARRLEARHGPAWSVTSSVSSTWTSFSNLKRYGHAGSSSLACLKKM
jgi:hypothetical protein